MGEAYVILQHSGWGPEHFDFLLQRGGGLDAWRLPAEGAAPWLLAAGEALPARPLPEHRTMYLTYEGPVGAGRGAVRRVDEGQWNELAREGGKVEFTLEGKRCRGRYEVRKGQEGGWELACVERGG